MICLIAKGGVYLLSLNYVIHTAVYMHQISANISYLKIPIRVGGRPVGYFAIITYRTWIEVYRIKLFKFNINLSEDQHV